VAVVDERPKHTVRLFTERRVQTLTLPIALFIDRSAPSRSLVTLAMVRASAVNCSSVISGIAVPPSVLVVTV
jgi:hypothetical protein